MKKQSIYDEKSFKQNTDIFYDTFLSYLEKWDYHFDDLKILRLIQLINCPTWDDDQQKIYF
jgi:hypothetical protein